MCTDDKKQQQKKPKRKLRFILSDYTVTREANQAWFTLFSKIALTFQIDVGCITPSVCLWHAKKIEFIYYNLN